MHLFPTSRQDVSKLIDLLIWWFFLALLIVISFVQSNYGSSDWYLVSMSVFFLCASVCFRSLNQERSTLELVKNSKVIFVFLSMSLLLLLLQIVVPYKISLYSLFSSNNSDLLTQPAWFMPDVVWSVVPDLTIDLFWSELTMVCGFLLTLFLVNSRSRLRQLLWVFCLVGMLHASVAIVAKYASVLLVEKVQVDGHFSAARAWFVNRNHFAAFITITMVGALAFQLKSLVTYKGAKLVDEFIAQVLSGRVIIVLILIVSFASLALSQSRAGFFAILLAIMLVVLASSGHSKMAGKKRLLMLLLTVLASGSVFYFGSDLIARFNGQAVTIGERAEQWQHTWTLIKQEWLLGYGGNSYGTVFQATRGQDSLRGLVYNQAHNDYLHIWLEQGLIGLFLWFCIIFVTFKRIWKTVVSNSSSNSSNLVYAFMIASAAVLLASLLQSIVGFNLQILNIRFYFFVIIGMVFAVPTIRHRLSETRK